MSFDPKAEQATTTAAITEDAVLGGRLRLRQPRRGHRVGHDAILLAAATPAAAGETAVDLGAGVGAAGLALAARVPGLAVALVEIDPALAALAADNVRHNGLADRVRAVALDVAGPSRTFADAGLTPGSAARVLMNPPFNDSALKASPDPGRRRAHAATPELIAAFLACGARLLAPGGTLSVIYRADGLATLLAALPAGLGSIRLLPVHPRAGDAAIRMLLRAEKGGRAPLRLEPPLVLADDTGRPAAAAEAVLRHGDTLPLAHAV
jgi:tRNA1(Val) A37 N6-methylase TrmN6